MSDCIVFFRGRAILHRQPPFQMKCLFNIGDIQAPCNRILLHPCTPVGPFPRIFSFVQPRLKDRFAAVAAPPSSSPPQSPSQPVNLVRRRLQKYRYISPSPSPPPPPPVQRGACSVHCSAAWRAGSAGEFAHVCKTGPARATGPSPSSAAHAARPTRLPVGSPACPLCWVGQCMGQRIL